MGPNSQAAAINNTSTYVIIYSEWSTKKGKKSHIAIRQYRPLSIKTNTMPPNRAFHLIISSILFFINAPRPRR